MNLHEYQGKEILASHGVRVQRGIVANNPAEAVAAQIGRVLKFYTPLLRETYDDPEQRLLLLLVARVIHSGMFPCFFGGSVSRLEASSRRARTTSTRVSCGVITAST